MSFTRPRSAPQHVQEGVPCCNCSAGVPKTVCTLHQSWLQLQDALIQKDHSLNSLSDKVSRLAIHESESKRKDDVITLLREEVAGTKKDLLEKRRRVIALEDEMAKKEHQRLQKEVETISLSEKLENVKERLSLAHKTNAGLQSQLAQKTDTLSAHSEELRELKKGKRFVEDGLSSTQEQMKEKQTTLMSLNERIRRLKNSNQELKEKLEDQQKECSKLTERERNLYEELSRMKQKSSSVSGQLENTRRQLTETSGINDELAAKVGSLQEQLDSLCHQLKSLIGLHTSTTPSSATDTAHIVTSVSTLITEQLKLKQKLSERESELSKFQERCTIVENDVEGVKKCLSTLQLPFAGCVPREMLISGTQSMLQELQLETEGVSLMKGSLMHLLAHLGEVHSILSSISQHVDHQNIGTKEESDASEDLAGSVFHVCEKAEEYKVKCGQLEEKLSITAEQQRSVLDQTLSSLRVEYERRVAEAIDEVRKEEKGNYNTALMDEKEKFETEKGEFVQEMNAKIEEANKNMEQLQLILKGKEEEINSLQSSVENFKETNYTLGKDVEEWRNKTERVKKDCEEVKLVSETNTKMREQQLQQSILEYKVQGQEHARTIVSLEQKLLASVRQCSILTSANEQLQDRVTTLDKELVACKERLKTKSEKSGEMIDTLRRQLSIANGQSGKQRIQMFELEEGLRETEEKFLKQIEGLQHQHQKEVEDLKEMLSHNELLTTKLNQQLSETRGELKGQGELARQINEENSLLLEKLSRLGPADGEEDEVRGREEASSPLSSIGKRCLGEQHEKVISSQQHALIDMRKKVNDLMTNKPPVPSHQAALKELVKLRQELSQMRAEEVLRQERERILVKERQSASREVDRSTTGTHKVKDLEEALNQSEQAYSLLLKSVCSKLSCPLPQSMAASSQNLSSANKVARQHILKEREEFVEGPLNYAISGLKRNRTKTDEPSEEAHSKKESDSSCEKRSATPDLTEFGVYSSRELEELDKQKRLYQAIFKRQEFKQSQLDRINRKPSHSCLVTPDEAQHMVETVRKSYTDKLQRKELEISKLKYDLHRIQQQSNTMASKMKLLKT